DDQDLSGLEAIDGDDADDARPLTPRLEVLKALGDNTRYAIYLELARAPRPLATSAVARSLGVHANTVRPHLERMREVGLLDVRSEARGVGRPQHRYSLAADAPSLGLEPSPYPALARMLLRLAGSAGIDADAAVDAGRDQGEADAAAWPPGSPCLEALMTELDAMGFDPEVAIDDDIATVAFAHCPFADLAAVDPRLVCGLHRGMVEGFVDAIGGRPIRAFATLVDRDPCRVELAVGAEAPG
ncbi:MAG TPA: helix-turn-helix domain-containing protein, partial [Acidimicrobiales bacterium]|nr:helix-turn-helix domain-containing protein [Acidimicrobiales bacterium]